MPGKRKKEKYFWSYISAMADMGISRRTLQRWIDDLDIASLEFEDHLRVFLTLPHMQKLREYGRFMRTRNQVLIGNYREAYKTENHRRLESLRRELDRNNKELNCLSNAEIRGSADSGAI